MKKLSFAALTAGSLGTAPKHAGGSSSSPVTSAAGSTRCSTRAGRGEVRHYAFTDGVMQFRTFLPNILYRLGLIPNSCLAWTQRTRAMSVVFAGMDWTPESLSPEHSVAGGLFGRLAQGELPGTRGKR